MPWLVLALALTMTGLNAVKPPVIDDPSYLIYAGEFLEHPARPYDFEYYGRAANGFLMPPVLIIWLSVGMSVTGSNDPVIMKLWLFPILLLYVGSLSCLLRRFAPQLRVPLLVLCVFSPVILPSINVMLDVPALALSLSALAVYFDAADRRSFVRALAAGLIAGLAMETKYTAFTLPAIFVMHGFIFGNWRLAIPPALLAVGIFCGVELIIAMIHGDSHFLLALSIRGERPLLNAVRLVVALVALSGGLAPMLWLIGLVALGYSRRTTLTLLGLVAAVYALLLLVPEPHDVLLQYPDNGKPLLILNHLFVPLGIAFLVTLGKSACRLLRTPSSSVAERQANDFLVFWLLIEVLAYLAISPFPAVRRLFGITIAATFLLGRLAIVNGLDLERLRMIRGLTAVGVALGLGYYLIDLEDAFAEHLAFDRAVAYVRQQDSRATIRFYGTWGLLTPARREGLIWTKKAGEDLQAGDWFIHDSRDGVLIPPRVWSHLRLEHVIVEEARFPLTTQRTFYASRTPIMRYEGARMEITIYRYWPEEE